MTFGPHASMLEPYYPFPDSLVTATGTGADSFEIDIELSRHGEPWHQRRGAWHARLKLAREMALDLGLALPSLCLGALWQYSLASSDEHERATAVEIVEDAVTWAASLGASALLLPVGQPPGLAVTAARRNLVASLRRCLKVAEAAGVTLALENLSQRLLYTSADFLNVLAEVDSPNCGIYFDPGNLMYVGEDPETALQRLGSYVVRVHLKDTAAIRRKVTMPGHAVGEFSLWESRTSVPLGKGDVDWAALRDALDTINYKAGFVLEVPPAPANACRVQLETARRFFKLYPRNNL